MSIYIIKAMQRYCLYVYKRLGYILSVNQFNVKLILLLCRSMQVAHAPLRVRARRPTELSRPRMRETALAEMSTCFILS